MNTNEESFNKNAFKFIIFYKYSYFVCIKVYRYINIHGNVLQCNISCNFIVSPSFVSFYLSYRLELINCSEKNSKFFN